MVLPETTVSGLVCLQGGAEFGAGCIDMDTEVLTRSPDGGVVVLAGAAAPGREHEMATRNAMTYYTRLTGRPVISAPDPREDRAGANSALAGAAVVVLPGGSPRRLLDVLAGEIGDTLRRAHEEGATLSGASAGAMVLCTHTVVPGSGVTDGLGIVAGVAIPHFDGSNWWDIDVGDDIVRWGLPECGGILVTDDGVEPLGAGRVMRRVGGRAEPVR